MAAGYEERSSGDTTWTILFSMFISNSKTERTLASFTDDTTPWGAVDMLEGRAAIQGHPKQLKEWANMSLMKLKVNASSGRNTPCRNTGWDSFD